jgi:O-antigen/teichoic acid export membrane protein
MFKINVGILASSTWINRAITFVTSLLIIRTLGPDLYGAYALGRKIFELDLAIVKYVPAYRKTKDHHELTTTSNTSLVLRLSFAALLSLLLILAPLLFVNVFRILQRQQVLLFFALSLPFFIFMNLSTRCFQAERRFNYFALINNIVLPVLRFLFSHHLLRTRFQQPLGQSFQRTSLAAARKSLIALPLAFFIILYPGNILSIFGNEFRAGKIALIPIALGQLFNCAVGAAGFILTMTGKQVYHLLNTFAFMF